MPPRSEEEKAQKKADYLKRKEERQKRKEQETKEEEKEDAAKSGERKKTPKAENDSSVSLLLDLPEDALKHVLCELSAAELGRVSMTCTQMNRALCSTREAYLLSRLRNSRMASLGPLELCRGSEEAK